MVEGVLVSVFRPRDRVYSVHTSVSREWKVSDSRGLGPRGQGVVRRTGTEEEEGRSTEGLEVSEEEVEGVEVREKSLVTPFGPKQMDLGLWDGTSRGLSSRDESSLLLCGTVTPTRGLWTESRPSRACLRRHTGVVRRDSVVHGRVRSRRRGQCGRVNPHKKQTENEDPGLLGRLSCVGVPTRFSRTLLVHGVGSVGGPFRWSFPPTSPLGTIFCVYPPEILGFPGFVE